MNWFSSLLSYIDDLIAQTTDTLGSFWGWLRGVFSLTVLLTVMTIMSAFATVCAAYASYQSYIVGERSASVAAESLKVSQDIAAENREQQRALLTVKSAEAAQYRGPGAYQGSIIDVTGLTIVLRNTGHNPANAIRIRGGTTYMKTFLAASDNGIASDSEQAFVSDLNDHKLEVGDKLHLGYEYGDENLRKCFYGHADFELVRNPKKLEENILVPIISNDSLEDVNGLKFSAECNEKFKIAVLPKANSEQR